jgi:hypothetical protein
MSCCRAEPTRCQRHSFRRAADGRREFQQRCPKYQLARVLFHLFLSLAALFVITLGGCGLEISPARASGLDEAARARAVEFCRGRVKRPMALDLDQRVLCFDGDILPDQDLSRAVGLRAGGLFVVRSFGGDRATAIRLAELLRKRDATVVAYDYCLSTCASFLLFASATAFVPRRTLVAWSHLTSEHLCPSLEPAKDDGPKRLEKKLCPDAPAGHQSHYQYEKELNQWFFSTRAVSPLFEHPPQSAVVRRILRNKVAERGVYPRYLFWTWNPRYYASMVTTKVVYEAYPNSQHEVDEMAARLRIRVIYDP